jgi:hypothetical protein
LCSSGCTGTCTLLSLPPECWDYRHASPHLASEHFSTKTVFIQSFIAATVGMWPSLRTLEGGLRQVLSPEKGESSSSQTPQSMGIGWGADEILLPWAHPLHRNVLGPELGLAVFKDSQGLQSGKVSGVSEEALWNGSSSKDFRGFTWLLLS